MEHARVATQAEIDQANKLAERVINARRANDSVEGARVVAELLERGSIRVLTIMIGTLATVAVQLEQRASAAHGPILDKDAVELDDMTLAPGVVAAQDMMQAAFAHGDLEGFAKHCVDAHVAALKQDRADPNYEVNLGHVIPSMYLMEQRTVCLVAAEALLRLSA